MSTVIALLACALRGHTWRLTRRPDGTSCAVCTCCGKSGRRP